MPEKVLFALDSGLGASNTSLLPREHGAWSMLTLPFLAAVYLLRPDPLRAAAAFIAVMALFLVREPLIVLARQRWVWRTPHEESAAARRWLLVLAPVLAAAGWVAIPRQAWGLAAAMGAGAAVLMAASIALAVRNRQHSALFQAIGSIGLAASSLAAGLTQPPLAASAWIVWAASALHGVSAIPVVHARLAMRRRQAPNLAPAAIGALAALAAAAASAPGSLSLPLGFSGLVHAAEWLALRSPGAPQAKLARLGLRLMAESILFTLLLVGALRH